MLSEVVVYMDLATPMDREDLKLLIPKGIEFTIHDNLDSFRAHVKTARWLTGVFLIQPMRLINSSPGLLLKMWSERTGNELLPLLKIDPVNGEILDSTCGHRPDIHSLLIHLTDPCWRVKALKQLVYRLHVYAKSKGGK